MLPSSSNQEPSDHDGTEKSSQSPDCVTNPLFNQNSQDHEHDANSPFTFKDDSSLPPASSETPYELVDSRRSVISAVDMEVLDESDFKDRDENFEKSADDLERILRSIKSVVLFEGYDEDELRLVANYMYNRKVAAGDTVIEFGGPGDAFYVVKSGKYRCIVPRGSGASVTVRVYEEAGYFGELALLNHAPRAATITALTDGQLWVLDALRNAWLRKHRAMCNAERFEQVIKAIPLFRDNLDPTLTNRLIDALEVVNLVAGDVICQQGDPGDAMYFIMEGEIEVRINATPVKRMEKNEFFGERALVLDEGRAATCQAVSPKLRLAKLSKESFSLIMPDSVVDRMRQNISQGYAASKSPARK